MQLWQKDPKGRPQPPLMSATPRGFRIGQLPCLQAKLASDFRSCVVVKTDAGAALPLWLVPRNVFASEYLKLPINYSCWQVNGTVNAGPSRLNYIDGQSGKNHVLGRF